ncbi:MAG: hypothetical protein ACREC4_06140, partial [Methylocella sp.]
AELGATIGGAGAVLGAIFVPSPNPGLVSEGAVPGDPGLRSAINHDEATLRLTRDGEVAAAAQRGQDGIFYEVETGTPIARDVGGSIVFDAATLASAAAPKETSQASREAASATQADTRNEPLPNLCPEPGPDAPHGEKERARLYQAQFSALINPQRPLPPGLAVTLNGVVYDDCRVSDGTMIEAKGPGLADVLENDSFVVAQGARAKLVDQATRQVQASGGRAIEWYFAEEAAADRARKIFDKDSELRRIFSFTVPAEAP